ncbi:MAG: MFS transporter [Anaerolineae bacterium]
MSAYRIYLLICGAAALLESAAYSMATIYYVQMAHLSPLQLVLVGTAVEATYFLFEVPTGVVADTYSRRLSVIVGFAIVGLAVAAEGMLPVFAAIVVAEAVRGVGETFLSGALEAWIADEIGAEAAGRAYLRGSQVGQVCSFAGIGAAVAMAGVGLGVPLTVSGLAMVLFAAVLVAAMPEQGFHPAPRDERQSWAAMAATMRRGLAATRARPRLLSILGIGLVFGAFSEGFDRLSEAHFLLDIGFPAWANLTPVVWLGILSAGAMLISLPITELARRRVDTASHEAVTRALFAINAGLSLAVIGFALAGQFVLALAAFWTASALRHVQDPLYTAWLNQNVDSDVRATVISMGGQANALGQIAGGPGIGALGSARGLRAALSASGAILAPALVLYRLLLGANHRDTEAQRTASQEQSPPSP